MTLILLYLIIILFGRKSKVYSTLFDVKTFLTYNCFIGIDIDDENMIRKDSKLWSRWKNKSSSDSYIYKGQTTCSHHTADNYVCNANLTNNVANFYLLLAVFDKSVYLWLSLVHAVLIFCDEKAWGTLLQAEMLSHFLWHKLLETVLNIC